MRSKLLSNIWVLNFESKLKFLEKPTLLKNNSTNNIANLDSTKNSETYSKQTPLFPKFFSGWMNYLGAERNDKERNVNGQKKVKENVLCPAARSSPCRVVSPLLPQKLRGAFRPIGAHDSISQSRVASTPLTPTRGGYEKFIFRSSCSRVE